MKADARLTNGLEMTELGERIRLERLRRRLSLEDLAKRADVSSSMLSSVERGEKVPTILVLDRIATGLGTSIARLLDDEQYARVVLLRVEEQRSEEHTSELQSHSFISYAVFCLK